MCDAKKHKKNAPEAHPVERDNSLSESFGEYRPEIEKSGHEQKTGTDLIAELAGRLPHSPGVYRMLNISNDVLYVGKARNLKKRVSSYTKTDGHTKRIARMIHETHMMEFITTHTETEALLLEANLIKRLRPRFNVLLRDDKSFPYIVITDEHNWPGIFKHRGARRKNRKYFGPFASTHAVTKAINAMQKAFLIRTCTDSVFEGRTRPCLLYQIKRCSAPCTGEISETDYKVLIMQLKQFLTGKNDIVQNRLSEQMDKASESLDFERAALCRDRLAAISHVRSQQSVNPGATEEADVFAISQKGGVNCVQVFFFRAGQNWGNQSYFPRADKSLEADDVLKSFLTQFYDNKPCPRLILLSRKIDEMKLIAEALSSRAERKVRLLVPARGEKRQLVDHALTNARDALGHKLAETSTQMKLLAGMAKAFGLDAPPQRIEVYDNSHIMGSNAVGAMIVSGHQGFAKNQYRKFNIKSKELTPGDDCGMMREVMTRRFSRLLKEYAEQSDKNNGKSEENENEISSWPDILLIDGGLGQLNSVLETLTELELAGRIPIVAIAKGPDRNAGRERFFIPGKPSFTLLPRDPVLYFVQRLRDEAHRFAIGSHRARRKKELTRNPLDEIDGIGPFRKRALLHHFGTAKAISQAALADLRTVEGISIQTAQVIYNYFHENQR